MTDLAWIHGALTAARPQAVGALLRYFRDMDRAEEAFQDACLKALKSWPEKGPPRDPAAWLILVGRNAALDGVRKQSRVTELPPDEEISDLDDAESQVAGSRGNPAHPLLHCVSHIRNPDATRSGRRRQPLFHQDSARTHRRLA